MDDDELSYFRKPNVRRFLPEALTADVQAVFADETGGMGANAANRIPSLASDSHVKNLYWDVRRHNVSGHGMAPTSRV